MKNEVEYITPLSMPGDSANNYESDASSLVVRMANSFIQDQAYVGRFMGTSLSAMQERIMQYSLAMFAKAFQGDAPDNLTVRFPYIDFSITGFLEACGCRNIKKATVNAVAEAALGLLDRCTTYRTQDPVTKAIRIGGYNWVQSVDVQTETGRCQITVNTAFEQQLRSLDEQKSISWLFSSISAMQSRYGSKLFGILNLHRGKENQLHIDMQTLCEKLDGTIYTKPSDVRRRVIDPAIQDINSYSGVMQVSYEIEKINKVYWFTFHIVDMETHLLTDGEIANEANAIKAQIGFTSIHADMISGSIPSMVHTLNKIVECIENVYTGAYSEYFINRTKIPAAKVAEQYKTLREPDIRFVLDTISNSARKEVKHGSEQAYLQTLLFNAPSRREMHEATKRAAKKNQKDQVPYGASGELGAAELEAIQRMMAEDVSSAEPSALPWEGRFTLGLAEMEAIERAFQDTEAI